MDTAFDKAAKRLRPLVFLACIAAVPIFLISYGLMLKLFFVKFGPLVFAGACASHVIVWLAASMLHDSQQEKNSKQPYSR